MRHRPPDVPRDAVEEHRRLGHRGEVPEDRLHQEALEVHLALPEYASKASPPPNKNHPTGDPDDAHTDAHGPRDRRLWAAILHALLGERG